MVIALSVLGLTTRDETSAQVRAELEVFTAWLDANDARGYIGEFGWPNDRPADRDDYNALAERYLRDMRKADLRGSVWATGEWWGSDYELSVYARSSSGGPIDTPRTQASVLERHTDIAGVHVNGGEFGAPSGAESTSDFSNRNPGTYDEDWHYDGQETFDFLASRGLKQVVIPFRWERIQPTLGEPLDYAELKRLWDVIARARSAGLGSIPMVANYGAYWLHDPATGRGVRRAIGSPEVTVAHYADLWRRLSRALFTEGGIAAYGLMREPIGQPGLTIRQQAEVWEEASQAAVDAVRNNDDRRLLLVPGYRYSNLHNWPDQHPTRWITDPADHHAYEAHHYWDEARSGDYGPY